MSFHIVAGLPLRAVARVAERWDAWRLILFWLNNARGASINGPRVIIFCSAKMKQTGGVLQTYRENGLREAKFLYFQSPLFVNVNIRHLPYDPAGKPAPAPLRVALDRHHTPERSERQPVVLHGNMALLPLQGHAAIQTPATAASVVTGGLLLLSAGHYLFSEIPPAAGSYIALQVYFSNEQLTDLFIKYHGYLPGIAPALRQPLLAYAPDAFLQQYAQSLQYATQVDAAKLEALLRYLLQQDAAKLRRWQIVAAQD